MLPQFTFYNIVCCLYVSGALWGIYFAHDLILFITLLFLFMIPLSYQHKRAKRLHIMKNNSSSMLTKAKLKFSKKDNNQKSYDEYCNILNPNYISRISMQSSNEIQPVKHDNLYKIPSNDNKPYQPHSPSLTLQRNGQSEQGCIIYFILSGT